MQANRCVLIVDDERPILEELTESLERRDINCLFALDGDSALDLLKHHTITHLLLDMRMSPMSGFSLLDKLRDSLEKGLKVIIISGHATTEDEYRALDKGALLFLRKPLTPDTIIKALEYAD